MSQDEGSVLFGTPTVSRSSRLQGTSEAPTPWIDQESVYGDAFVKEFLRLKGLGIYNCSNRSYLPGSMEDTITSLALGATSSDPGSCGEGTALNFYTQAVQEMIDTAASLVGPRSNESWHGGNSTDGWCGSIAPADPTQLLEYAKPLSDHENCEAVKSWFDGAQEAYETIKDSSGASFGSASLSLALPVAALLAYKLK